MAESPTARELGRKIQAVIIAICPDTPYPDDPRWTPWTRFGKRACAKVEQLVAQAEQGIPRGLSLADLAVLLARAGYDVDEYEDGGERYTVAVREKEPSDG
jgi:hypothetical protein